MTVRLLPGMRTALFCGIVASLVIPLRGDSSAVQKEILHLEDVLTQAWLKRDVATISPIIADDYQDWSEAGVRVGKAELLEAVRKNAGDHTRVEDPLVRVYGDTAIFTARVVETGKALNGRSPVTTTCTTDVFIRRSGKWVVVASQETALPKH